MTDERFYSRARYMEATFDPDRLRPWELSGMLTPTRTVGQVGLHRNGTEIDVWVRVDGRPCWFAFSRTDLERFLGTGTDWAVLAADSDGNVEEVLVPDEVVC